MPLICSGLTTNKSYPYADYSASATTPACKPLKLYHNVVNVTGDVEYLSYTTNTSSLAEILVAEEQIMSAVYQGYPVTVFVASSSACFQTYFSGVLSCSCSGSVDLALLVVGYTPSYFVVRNQWYVYMKKFQICSSNHFVLFRSIYWGLNGYAYIPRASSNSWVPGIGQCSMFQYNPFYVSAVQSLPTQSPTSSRPSASPSAKPSFRPSKKPSMRPTISPTTGKPTLSPSHSRPSASPSAEPTHRPSYRPSNKPTFSPTFNPTVRPTIWGQTWHPSKSPSRKPTFSPTHSPTHKPSRLPSKAPTKRPITQAPTHRPTKLPSDSPVHSSPTGIVALALKAKNSIKLICTLLSS